MIEIDSVFSFPDTVYRLYQLWMKLFQNDSSECFFQNL